MGGLRGWMLVLPLVGCVADGGNGAPGRSAGSPEGVRAQLLLSDSEAALQAGSYGTRFNFVYLRDLWLRAQVPGLSHVSVLTVRFILPSGMVFYQDRFPFSLDEKMDVAMMPGLAHPTTVFRGRRVPGGVALDHPIAIAGSVFQRFPTSGRWRVEAQVEGWPGTLSSPMDVEWSR